MISANAAQRAVALVNRTIPAEIQRAKVVVIAQDAYQVRSPRSGHLLVPVWAGEGFPADVLSALRTHARPLPKGATLVLTAREFSRGARVLLESSQTNWADETGRVHIVVPPGIYISRSDLSGGFAKRAVMPFQWSAVAGAVAEYLLESDELSKDDGDMDPRLPLTAEVASSIEWSTAVVSRVLRGFDTEGWTAKGEGPQRGRGSTRHFIDRSGLLSSWAGWYRTRHLDQIGAHSVWRDTEDFWTNQLAPRLPVRTSALSGWLALEKVAGFVTDIPTVTCYLEPPVFDEYLPQLMEASGLRQVKTGARVTFIRAEAHVLSQSQRVDNATVVSNTRLYGDLLRLDLRGEDAAQHLREARIGY